MERKSQQVEPNTPPRWSADPGGHIWPQGIHHEHIERPQQNTNKSRVTAHQSRTKWRCCGSRWLRACLAICTSRLRLLLRLLLLGLFLSFLWLLRFLVSIMACALSSSVRCTCQLSSSSARRAVHFCKYWCWRTVLQFTASICVLGMQLLCACCLRTGKSWRWHGKCHLQCENLASWVRKQTKTQKLSLGGIIIQHQIMESFQSMHFETLKSHNSGIS